MLSRAVVEQILWQGALGTNEEISEARWEGVGKSEPVSDLPELAARLETYGWTYDAIRCWERHAAEAGVPSSREKAAWLHSVKAAD